jgi:hypothetical protein
MPEQRGKALEDVLVHLRVRIQKLDYRIDDRQADIKDAQYEIESMTATRKELQSIHDYLKKEGEKCLD